MMGPETFQKILSDIEQKGLRRSLRDICSAQGPRIVVDGREVVNLCSNNYLGLADDVRLKQAAAEAIGNEGVGSGASRLVCGNMESHRKLEKTLAEFKGTESGLLFSTGYMANVGIISGLFDEHDLILSDKLNHASIIDGILLSRAPFKRYPHRDIQALERYLKNSVGYQKRVIITDSVFSMDGDLAPLEEITDLAQRFDAMVMVDDAHALGVLGKNGKGAVEHFGLEGKIDIQMGTLSKAAGVFGAYVCCSREIKECLINRARSFVYTTGLPPMVCAAAERSIGIMAADHQRRRKLWENADFFKKGLTSLGFDTMQSQTPIIPVLLKNAELAVRFSRRLWEEGVFVQAIRPPTVPQDTARLRVTVMATHRTEDLGLAIDKFQLIGKELCLI